MVGGGQHFCFFGAKVLGILKRAPAQELVQKIMAHTKNLLHLDHIIASCHPWEGGSDLVFLFENDCRGWEAMVWPRPRHTSLTPSKPSPADESGKVVWEENQHLCGRISLPDWSGQHTIQASVKDAMLNFKFERKKMFVTSPK